ncbi:hypothetical protein [Chryseobacterium sp. OV279]|uniref:hypothetical protein n=1 Tax=Chryseobacterium sp. OV279 TaxID=1500285 RepID=UPI00091BE825|nr:hypothetical protein [Chryseobacterium sp. OV279]SHF92282.1 hypothetical protein SAMN02787100_2987 [Chryseobacterium sp. OV279]
MKKTTIAIILLASLNNIFGQGNQSQYDPSVRNVPTSPEVALLGRFGDIPVGHYTGTAAVSVPLYTLKVDNIEIPLALTYHTSGIKVADEATWVGLGWNFMPEGTITQEVRGKEDYWTSGGDGFSNNAGYNLFKSHFFTVHAHSQMTRLQVGYNGYNAGGMVVTNPAVDDSPYIINDLKEKKGQPDIFTYNFYGYSGKFFFNPENGNEILFMESNDDVKFTKNGLGWVATTNRGDKFYFYAVEKSKTDLNSYTDIGYTFKISQIELTSGKTITFSYLNETTNLLYPAQVAHLTNFSGPLSSSVVNDNNSTINEKKTLIGIETDDTKIEFNLDNREDIRPASLSTPIKKLSSIDIKSKYPNKKIKSFVFGTSYFNPSSGSAEENYRYKRLKLNSIQEVNYNEMGAAVQSTPPYSFEYNMTKTMPSKMSSSDFYGYNNGSNSSTLLPDLAFFDYLNKSPYKNYGLTVNYPYNGTMRFTDTQYTATNILEKVFYPTGARTEFEYESNTFSNQFIPTPQQALSANKDVSLNHRGAEPSGNNFSESPVFKLSQTQVIKFYNTIYDGYMGPSYPEVHYEPYGMWDCKIKFFKRKTVNGQQVSTLIKQWAIDVPGPTFEQTHSRIWDEDLTVAYDSDPTTEYYVRIENPLQYRSNDGMHRAIVSTRFRYYDDTNIDKSISYGSGIRVKSIKNYENSTLLSHKAYTYTGGKLIYKFEPLTLIPGATSKSQPPVLTGGCFLEYVTIFNDLSVNSNDFGISGNKPFGYSQVTEKDINVLDGTTKGSTVYYFTNNEFTNSLVKGVPRVDIPSNGENTMIEKYDHNQNIISSQRYIFDDLPNTYGVYPSFSMINSSVGSMDPSNNFYPYSNGCTVIGLSYTGNTYQNPLSTTKYRFIFSPLITGKRRLMSMFDTSHFGNKALVEKTVFSYTNSGDLDTSILTTSEGKVITTNYDYASDTGNTRLINKGMTGIPLKISTTSEATAVSRIETKYDNLNNFLPSSVLSSGLDLSSTDTEVTYNRYDAKGNLLQYTSKEGIPVALIWGYSNTKVIAKIEGVTYDQAIALAGYNDMVTKSGLDINVSTQNTFIDALDIFRKSNAGLLITTYTYDPLIGVTSLTPPSGMRELYIYDDANRLKQVADVNGSILKEFNYNYKN